MENKIIPLTDNIFDLVKNTHLDLNLHGWPAAVTAVAFFCSCVAIYALKVTHPEHNPNKRNAYASSGIA
ncbi:MAG: hypothetical protein KH186_08120 [Lachnospiraceae bacterium]|nr:hypothetical protein [Lachnospiraceae bacterium]